MSISKRVEEFSYLPFEESLVAVLLKKAIDHLKVIKINEAGNKEIIKKIDEGISIFEKIQTVFGYFSEGNFPTAKQISFEIVPIIFRLKSINRAWIIDLFNGTALSDQSNKELLKILFEDIVPLFDPKNNRDIEKIAGFLNPDIPVTIISLCYSNTTLERLGEDKNEDISSQYCYKVTRKLKDEVTRKKVVTVFQVDPQYLYLEAQKTLVGLLAQITQNIKAPEEFLEEKDDFPTQEKLISGIALTIANDARAKIKDICSITESNTNSSLAEVLSLHLAELADMSNRNKQVNNEKLKIRYNLMILDLASSQNNGSYHSRIAQKLYTRCQEELQNVYDQFLSPEKNLNKTKKLLDSLFIEQPPEQKYDIDHLEDRLHFYRTVTIELDSVTFLDTATPKMKETYQLIEECKIRVSSEISRLQKELDEIKNAQPVTDKLQNEIKQVASDLEKIRSLNSQMEKSANKNKSIEEKIIILKNEKNNFSLDRINPASFFREINAVISSYSLDHCINKQDQEFLKNLEGWDQSFLGPIARPTEKQYEKIIEIICHAIDLKIKDLMNHLDRYPLGEINKIKIKYKEIIHNDEDFLSGLEVYKENLEQAFNHASQVKEFHDQFQKISVFFSQVYDEEKPTSDPDPAMIKNKLFSLKDEIEEFQESHKIYLTDPSLSSLISRIDSSLTKLTEIEFKNEEKEEKENKDEILLSFKKTLAKLISSQNNSFFQLLVKKAFHWLNENGKQPDYKELDKIIHSEIKKIIEGKAVKKPYSYFSPKMTLSKEEERLLMNLQSMVKKLAESDVSSDLRQGKQLPI